MKINSIKKPDRGWHEDLESHKKAGQKGKSATPKSHGKSFYVQISRRGGKKSGGILKIT